MMCLCLLVLISYFTRFYSTVVGEPPEYISNDAVDRESAYQIRLS